MTRVRQPKKNTYERIIEESLELFNQEGERKISTNHIAAHLNISPGNLYYHFANKDEIIIQIFRRYRSDVLNFLKVSKVPVTAPDIVNFIGSIFDIMWCYRFFFTDVNTLLSRNSELQNEHDKFTLDVIYHDIQRYIKVMIEAEVLFMDEIDMQLYTINFWLLIKYWFVFDRSLHNNELQAKSKDRGIRQLLGMTRPYLNPQIRNEFTQLLSTME